MRSLGERYTWYEVIGSHEFDQLGFGAAPQHRPFESIGCELWSRVPLASAANVCQDWVIVHLFEQVGVPQH